MGLIKISPVFTSHLLDQSYACPNTIHVFLGIIGIILVEEGCASLLRLRLTLFVQASGKIIRVLEDFDERMF